MCGSSPRLSFSRCLSSHCVAWLAFNLNQPPSCVTMTDFNYFSYFTNFLIILSFPRFCLPLEFYLDSFTVGNFNFVLFFIAYIIPHLLHPLTDSHGVWRNVWSNGTVGQQKGEVLR